MCVCKRLCSQAARFSTPVAPKLFILKVKWQWKKDCPTCLMVQWLWKGQHPSDKEAAEIRPPVLKVLFLPCYCKKGYSSCIRCVFLMRFFMFWKLGCTDIYCEAFSSAYGYSSQRLLNHTKKKLSIGSESRQGMKFFLQRHSLFTEWGSIYVFPSHLEKTHLINIIMVTLEA